MYSAWQLGIRYLKYYFTSDNGKGHGVHSPFVFGFITKVLNDDRHFYAYRSIENLRQMLLADTREISIEDMGAGSKGKKLYSTKIKDLARSALKPKKFGQLLFRIVDHYGPVNILELGTSLGITTTYLASGKTGCSVTTMEGAPEVAAIAVANFNKLHLDNISLVKGNFDETLAATILALKKIDLVFVDGNHRYEPTMRYYRQLLTAMHEDSIMIFDDIHWSAEMEKAWEEIKQDDAVTLTIDLFFIGLVFFRKENKVKQHFTIRF
jgi:predicted O-methyltransferase YrrM